MAHYPVATVATHFFQGGSEESSVCALGTRIPFNAKTQGLQHGNENGVMNEAMSTRRSDSYASGHFLGLQQPHHARRA